MVGFFIVDIVINYYIEFIEVFFIVDIARYCYIEYMVDRIYYIRFICFLIDILYGNYRKFFVGDFFLF